MVGFSLKKKVEQPKKSGFGFSIKKKDAQGGKKAPLKAFGKAEDDDEDRVVVIDTFDATNGGYDEETGPAIDSKGPLVIKNAGNEDWKKVAKERFNPSQQRTTQPEEARKLEYGINFVPDKKGLEKRNGDAPLVKKKTESDSFRKDVARRPEMATLDEYEEVPVEDFGAAMLRGMGWTGDLKAETEKKEGNPVTRRPNQLGLGAKALPVEDDESVSMKEYLPIKMINRATGREEVGSTEREKSPKRTNGSNYRSR